MQKQNPIDLLESSVNDICELVDGLRMQNNSLREALKDAHPHIANDNIRAKIGAIILKAEGK